jgi:hypothetical protein
VDFSASVRSALLPGRDPGVREWPFTVAYWCADGAARRYPFAADYAKDAKDGKNVMQTAADTSSIWQRMLWGTRLTVGVNDAFNRQPPSVIGAFNDNYDTSLYSIRNRYWYVSLDKKF